MKRILLALAGVICVLLGGLWLLQGLGAVRLEPILCVANCEAIQGVSPAWAAIGGLTAAAGAAALAYAAKRR